MKSMRRIIFLLVSSLSIATPTKITITGSSTIAPLAVELGKAYELKHPGLRIDVQSGGSSRGISDARQGLADLGMVSRALKTEEKDLRAHMIAIDGICVILNKANPTPTLTDEQIIGIYTGKIKNWKEVGGKDAPITVVNKAEGRSTLELFLHYYKLKSTDIKAQVVIGDNQQGIKTVSGNPNAIGYVSIGSAEYDAQNGVPIKLMAMNGFAASTENILNGKFPLSRPLNLVTKTAYPQIVKDFLAYAKSKEANAIIKEQFFVPTAK